MRPERPHFVQQFREQIPADQFRLAVKPGVTGLAQVYGRYSTTAERKLRFDLTYVTKYSLLMGYSPPAQHNRRTASARTGRGYRGERRFYLQRRRRSDRPQQAMRSIGVPNMIETVIDTDIEKRDATGGRWLAGLRRRTGLDRAIAYTVMARVFQIVGEHWHCSADRPFPYSSRTGLLLHVAEPRGPADGLRTGIFLRDPATRRA